MNTLEQRLQRLEDESAIRALVARFADTCIRADHDGFKALWTDDGIWEIGAPFNVSAKASKPLRHCSINYAMSATSSPSWYRPG
ncbi:nuclear transport factor 2 family protein [Xanthomonas sp. WHRI 6106]|uniref:nuclear transport factor 2 family protein n=1 Tax=Xanthomonas sp. WHRI 6106 TaxID=3161566 RepID=UPI0032E8EE28